MSMDKKIERSKKPLIIKSVLGGIAAIALLVLGQQILSDSSIATYRVDRNKVMVRPVTQGLFEDFITERGTLIPGMTMILEASQGGRVEKILVEEGDMVKAGQPLVELSNPDLQLEVLRSEAEFNAQVNALRQAEFSIEQSKQRHELDMLNYKNTIESLTEDLERNERLAAENAVSQKQLSDSRRNLQHQINQRDLAIRGRETQVELQKIDLEGQQAAVERMQRSMDTAHRSIEDLTIKAPIDGQLTSLNVQLGQSVGGELGQIDVIDNYKLSVPIDEYYINRVQIGQYGEASIDDVSFRLLVTKIYPKIDQSQFEVDMEFQGEQPDNLRRGQTLQLDLQLGAATDTLLLPKGSFFQETGGSWIFVLNEDGDAVRREIELGRRNSDFYEVLDGLLPGEEVIVSDYSTYTDVDRIQFN